jgi:hypothetical protein
MEHSFSRVDYLRSRHYQLEGMETSIHNGRTELFVLSVYANYAATTCAHAQSTPSIAHVETRVSIVISAKKEYQQKSSYINVQ